MLTIRFCSYTSTQESESSVQNIMPLDSPDFNLITVYTEGFTTMSNWNEEASALETVHSKLKFSSDVTNTVSFVLFNRLSCKTNSC